MTDWLVRIATARRRTEHQGTIEILDKFEAFVLQAYRHDRVDCIDDPEKLFVAALADEMREVK